MVCLLVCAGVGAFAQSGVISDMTGTVELKPAGADAFTLAKTGDSVAMDTVVSTGFKSTATIKVGSAVIIARPLTRLTLAEITAAQGTEAINVNLQAGRIRVDVKPPAGTKTSFTVQSPHATASVRGTEFDQDTRSVWVREGTVAYQGARGPLMLVPAGSESRVNTTSSTSVDPVVTALEALTPLPPVGMDTAVDPTAPAGTATTRPDINIGVELGFN
jgi:hypothetical protein